MKTITINQQHRKCASVCVRRNMLVPRGFLAAAVVVVRVDVVVRAAADAEVLLAAAVPFLVAAAALDTV